MYSALVMLKDTSVWSLLIQHIRKFANLMILATHERVDNN